MKVAIMQPYFFPYIGYFQLINAVDKFVIYDDVNFINKGWINRNNILVNSNKHLFQIPLKAASQNKLINEIEIVSEEKWKLRLLKMVTHSYAKCAYFEPVFELFCKVLHKNENKIASLNFLALKSVCDYLGIHREIVTTSIIYNNQHLRGQNRILDICRIEKADIYINPIGGIGLYHKKFFDENEIQLFFIQSIEKHYKQTCKVFVPWLSILDMLMNIGRDQIFEQLNSYHLIQE